MQMTKSRLATIFAALVLVATSLAVGSTAVTDSAQAGACYDSAQYFFKKSDVSEIPTGDGWWKTTSNCNDINVQNDRHSSYGRYVKVCFNPSSGSNYCQSDWTWLPIGEWVVVATNVRDGTYYRLQFQWDAAAAGYRAA